LAEPADQDATVPKTLKIGEHVRWNSQAARVSGIIIKKTTSDKHTFDV
jgi:hypothetical protein